MDTPAVPRRSGKRPHIGFRLEADLVDRIDAVAARLAAQQPLLSAPDRSTVLRAIVARGVGFFEAELGIAAPSPAQPPAASAGEPVDAPEASAGPGAGSGVHRAHSGRRARPASPKASKAAKSTGAKGKARGTR